MPEAVQVRGLRKTWRGGAEALRGLDLEVREGEVFGLVGPDGAGKTTLLKVLAGVLSFSAGEARVLGRPLPQGIDQVRDHIGYLPQRFSLYGDMTVAENLAFYADLYPQSGDLEERKRSLLETIGLGPFRDRMAAALSGGMKQKLALMCALVHEPQLLLMDESTVGVDPVSRREFWGLVFGLQRSGLTVLAATPYMDEAEQFDRIALLHEGRLLRVGTPQEVRESVPGLVLEVACDRPFEAARRLEGLAGVEDVQLFGDRLHLYVAADRDDLRRAVEGRLAESGLQLQELRPAGYSVEDVFLKVTA